MSDLLLYKGYTQHLISANPFARDDDDASLRVMHMTPGLFVSTDWDQGVNYLPVCKFINDYRYEIVRGVTVALNDVCTHPLRGYASVTNGVISPVNPGILPPVIAGGIVCINNFMSSTKAERGYSIFTDDYRLLKLNEMITELWSYDVDGRQAAVLRVNQGCKLVLSQYTYTFELIPYDSVSYRDFIAKIE